MQRLSSFSHAWTHVVQYRAQSLLPCPFYHKSQSSEASNHKSTDEATIISLFTDSASPSSSSRSHLIALVTPSSTSKGLPGCKWCSPSNALSQTTTQKNIVDVTAMRKEVKYSYYLNFFVHKASISKLQFAKGH